MFAEEIKRKLPSNIISRGNISIMKYTNILTNESFSNMQLRKNTTFKKVFASTSIFL